MRTINPRSLALGLFALSVSTDAVPPSTAAAGLGDVYLGAGCFWARQHSLINDVERALFHRADADLTAIAGYAGGKDQHDDAQVSGGGCGGGAAAVCVCGGV